MKNKSATYYPDTQQQYGESTKISDCMQLNHNNSVMNIFNRRNFNTELSTLHTIETFLV